MSSTKSPSGVQTRTVGYDDFQGIDATRDITALDTQKKQHLSQLDGGFCDWRGQIVKDPGASPLLGRFRVVNATFYAKDHLVWAEQDGEAIHLKSDTDLSEKIYARNSVISSTVFNRRVHFFSSAQQAWNFDGSKFTLNKSLALDALRPAFGVAISRRLAVAGIPGSGAEVHLSRVDDHTVMPDDEDNTSTSVLRAAKLDISNYIGAGEDITGLARFEQNKLAIFTPDRAIVFAIDPDVSQWTIDERANINVGCIAHNTIAMAGEDVIFCSRAGVHALSRSRENGIAIVTDTLADKVDILYRQLVASCPNPEEISAVFDRDMGQYHIFFPQPGGTNCKRLTVTLKAGVMDPKWSTSSFLNARCGAFQGGRLVFGTAGGLYDIGKIEDETQDTYPSMVMTTPYLWHGSILDTKSTSSIIIQASGAGSATLEAFDDAGRKLHSDTFEIADSPDDNNFPDVPLSRQYERRFEQRYRGVQLRLTVTGKGLVRISGFAVVVRKE